MDGLKFFHQPIIILSSSIPVVFLFNKIKLPSIIGFLITGIIIGPFGLTLIDDLAGIQLMAEIGEFSFVLALQGHKNQIISESCLSNAKALNPRLHVIVRTKYMTDIEELLAQETIETFYIAAQNPIVGKSIRDINLKARTGALINNITRGNQTRTNPPGKFILKAADQIILFGSHNAIDMALVTLSDEKSRELPAPGEHLCPAIAPPAYGG